MLNISVILFACIPSLIMLVGAVIAMFIASHNYSEGYRHTESGREFKSAKK